MAQVVDATFILRHPEVAGGGGIAGGFAYLLVGWCALLVPTLIRSIEATHERSDAEFGMFYLGHQAV
jgi:hypothetical protein